MKTTTIPLRSRQEPGKLGFIVECGSTCRVKWDEDKMAVGQ